MKLEMIEFLLVITILITPHEGFMANKLATTESYEEMIHAIIGRPVTMPCRLDFIGGQANVLWDRDADIIAVNKTSLGSQKERRKIGGEDCGDKCYDLTIFQTRTADEGSYRCQVLTKYKRLYKLIVQIPPKLLTFSPNTNQILLILGTTNFTLNCSFYAKPQAFISWYKEAEELLPGEKVLGNTSSYIISVVTLETEGRYTCSGNNGYGEEALHHFNVSVAYPPEITQISGDTMINLASNVTLVCIARSNPNPIIRWHKEEDGDDESNLYEDLGYASRNELYLDHRVELNGHTATSHLVIINTTTASDGRYVCKASNSQGFTTQKVFLRGKPAELSITSGYNGNFCCEYHLTWSVLTEAPLLHLQVILEKTSIDPEELTAHNFFMHFPEEAQNSHLDKEQPSSEDITRFKQNPYYFNDAYKIWNSRSEISNSNREVNKVKTYFEPFTKTPVVNNIPNEYPPYNHNYDDSYKRDLESNTNNDHNTLYDNIYSNSYHNPYSNNDESNDYFSNHMNPFYKHQKNANNHQEDYQDFYTSHFNAPNQRIRKHTDSIKNNENNIHLTDNFAYNHNLQRNNHIISDGLYNEDHKNNKTITVALGRSNTYTIRDLEADTEYRITIRVGNAFGYSYWTDFFLFKTSSDIPPQADESYKKKNALRSFRHGSKGPYFSKLPFHRSSASSIECTVLTLTVVYLQLFQNFRRKF